MSDKKSVDFRGKLDASAVAVYLEALARGLRDGRVVLESGEAALELEVGAPVEVELEARYNAQKGRCRVDIELEWHTDAVPNRTPQTLSIGHPAATDGSHADLRRDDPQE